LVRGTIPVRRRYAGPLETEGRTSVQKYECVVVLRSGLPETDANAILDRFESSVNNHGGEITLKDPWGTKKLAYEIQKQTMGDYYLYRFTGDNGLVKEADRDYRLDDRVLRHLIVIDEEWDERNRVALAKRAEQRSRNEGVSDGR
jgi:small subunit ribosomal protein S6